MSDRYNFSLVVGSSANFQLNATNSDGSYINLAGYQARGQVRYNYSSSTILFNLNPTIHSSYTSGIVNLNITGSSTTGIAAGVYPYDLEVYTTGDGGVETYTSKFLRGYFFLDPEATR